MIECLLGYSVTSGNFSSLEGMDNQYVTRILCYNILGGGTHRVDQLTKLIGSAHPDIVGLVEATDPQVIEELAQRLGMQFSVNGQADSEKWTHLAVLSRLPIVQVQTHSHPDIFTRKDILEVCVEEPGERQLTLFVVHLTSRFHKGRQSNLIRRGEVQEILRIMADKQGMQHALIGDFNSVAPGEPVRGSSLLRSLLQLDQLHKEKPALFVPYANLSIVRSFRRHIFLRKILQTIVRSKVLSALVDTMSSVYAQGGIDLLFKAGYIDCFRQANPHSLGFTYPASAPIGRVDFIFASPELARRLSNCNIVTEGKGISEAAASDHLPVCAEFADA
jgi:endonuclease/exonuclease/phosphatase family metal-dependent hydrolase